MKRWLSTRRPVARAEEHLVEPRLRGAGLRAPAVAPAHQRRQRHEDRLRPSARLDAEEGAAVVEQVELDIAPAPVELEVALALAVGGLPAAAQDRQVGGEEGVAHGAGEGERAREPPLAEVVEEEAAD